MAHQARAVATRCFIPPEARRGAGGQNQGGRPAPAKRARASGVRPRAPRRHQRELDVLRCRLLGSSKDSERRCRSCRAADPSPFPHRCTSPAVGAISPPRSGASVDLPHPLGPTTHTNAPSSMLSDVAQSAELLGSAPKICDTLRTVISCALTLISQAQPRAARASIQLHRFIHGHRCNQDEQHRRQQRLHLKTSPQSRMRRPIPSEEAYISAKMMPWMLKMSARRRPLTISGATAGT